MLPHVYNPSRRLDRRIVRYCQSGLCSEVLSRRKGRGGKTEGKDEGKEKMREGGREGGEKGERERGGKEERTRNGEGTRRQRERD